MTTHFCDSVPFLVFDFDGNFAALTEGECTRQGARLLSLKN